MSESDPDERESMKSGAGDDPFADDGTTADQSGSESAATSQEDPVGEINDTPVENPNVVDPVPFAEDTVPIKIMRDNIKTSRDGNVLQIALYQQTEDLLVDGEKEIRAAFDDKISKMDFNEAVLLAGLMNLDDVYGIFKAWGYDWDQSEIDK
jgi:hypothetical protein